MTHSHTDKILRLTPEDSKLFVEACMDHSEPNEANDRAFSEGMLRAVENYSKTRQNRKTLDERYENISAIIAEKCDKSWLREKRTSEDSILEECIRLCKEVV